MDMYGVAKSTLYQRKRATLLAIVNVFKDSISFPWGNIAELGKMADGFEAANLQSLQCCVLAIDGILIKNRVRIRATLRTRSNAFVGRDSSPLTAKRGVKRICDLG